MAGSTAIRLTVYPTLVKLRQKSRSGVNRSQQIQNGLIMRIGRATHCSEMTKLTKATANITELIDMRHPLLS